MRPDHEYNRVLRLRLAAIESEDADLARHLEQLMGRRQALAAEMGHLRALLGVASEPSDGATSQPESPVADLVVQLLTEVGGPMHYRDIASALSDKHGVS